MKSSPKPDGQGGTLGGQLEDNLAQTLEALIRRDLPRSVDVKALGFLHDAAETCPNPGEWIDLASGKLEEERSFALLNHAAFCISCLGRLRESQGLFSGEAPWGKSAPLDQFRTASPDWQNRLAAELARTSYRNGSKQRVRWFRWSGAGLAAAVAVLVALLLWRRDHLPERLLAQAYSQDRIFEVRMPGARFAPATPRLHLRGAGKNQEPVSLITARAQIEKKLKEHPTDPHWLELEARTAMLEENYDLATDILDRLVAKGPVNSTLLLDDGTAHFLRGTMIESQENLSAALNALRRADELSPADPVVLFNEALVMENQGQFVSAVQVWNRYLSVEHDPQWHAEGSRRLKSAADELNRGKAGVRDTISFLGAHLDANRLLT